MLLKLDEDDLMLLIMIFSILLILNYSLENTESAIKSKLKDLLPQWRGFKLVMALLQS